MPWNIKQGSAGFKQYHWEVKGGWIYKDGEKFFPKGVHYPAIYNDSMRLGRFSAVDRIHNVGFNVIQAPLKIANFDDSNESHDDKFISQCHYRGIHVIVANNDPGGYLTCFDYYGEHPACMGFYSFDDVQNQESATVNTRYKELKRRYPNRLVYMSGGTSNMEAKTGDADIIAYQRYPMIFADGSETYTSLASATSELVKVQKPNMIGNTATLINNQMFKWYDCEEWVDNGVTKRIGNFSTYCNEAGADYHPVPSALTETHYRNILYQGLISGCTGFMAYAWADWVTREAGLTEENNLTTNSTLQLAVRRVNAEIDYIMPYLKHGELRGLIMPSESYAATWAYKGRLLIIGVNGKAAAGTISSGNEVMYNMRGKVSNPFPWRTATSLTNDRKTLTWTALPWNATEIYEVAISD